MRALLITVYSITIALSMPESLSDPFGLILKNVPILAILFILFSEETSS